MHISLNVGYIFAYKLHLLNTMKLQLNKEIPKYSEHAYENY